VETDTTNIQKEDEYQIEENKTHLPKIEAGEKIRILSFTQNDSTFTMKKREELMESRCLIHNAHLRKIPRFCKIKDLKIIHLKRIFD
jgi:hypothetical protein